jgi:hypothetical protein
MQQRVLVTASAGGVHIYRPLLLNRAFPFLD